MIAWLHRLGRHRPLDAPRQLAFAERDAKPRVRIRPDGWIRHRPSAFPFSPKVLVEVKLSSGATVGDHLSDYAGSYPESWWRNEAQQADNNISFYRIVGMPPR